MRNHLVICLLCLSQGGFSTLSRGAEKPSPFAARQSVPAVAPAAPVSPVVPMSILRALRARPVAVSSGPAAVSPLSRAPMAESRTAADAPPQVAPVLKTVVLESPALRTMAPEIVAAQMRPPQVGEIAKGAVKSEVLAKLGTPATVISMSEGGRFLESLRYEWNGKWMGTVRMVDGRVATVEPR